MRRVVAASLVAAAAWACRSPSLGPYRDAPVVLVSIDTLRADRLPLYGHAGGKTSVLDAFGREGIVLEDVYSPCPLTLPAHASLFTGRLPPAHGVRNNMGFTLEGHETLAERLKAAGFRTGGAVSAYVLRGETGIARGFEFYEDALVVEAGSEFLDEAQRDGAVAVEALLEWIGEIRGRPFFAFLHLYEPHTPYSPPPPYDRLGDAYDGEVAYADALVGRFFDGLRRLGVYDGAVIVVTSDHGEGLGDHGEQEHGIFLYRETAHVPFVLRLPGGARGGTRVAGTAGLADVPATLLDLLGRDAGGIEGRSLRPGIASGRLQSEPVYSETLFPRYHLGWSELYAVTEGPLRYIQAPRPELYDLAADPRETRNLVGERGTAAAAMARWLEAHVSGAAATPAEVPPEVREKLQALGYVGGPAPPVPGEALADPKDRIGSYEELKRALALRRGGRDAEAVPALRKVLGENPCMLDGWQALGLSLARLSRFDEAVKALGEAVALVPDRAETHLTLAKIQALRGDLRSATTHAEIAARRDPGAAHEVLAQFMLDAGRLDRAAAFAKRSLEADPERLLSHFVLGVAAQDAGRFEEALGHYQRTEAIRARRPETIVRGLGARAGFCLAQLGRGAEAERVFLEEIRRVPASAEARQWLALLYWSQGRDASAREVLAALVAADPRPEAYRTVVRTFQTLGDAEAVRLWTARARERFPDDPRFHAGPDASR